MIEEYHPELKSILAKILRERREALHMSKRQLARASYVERSYISAIENAQYNPTINVILHLCDALKIKPALFMEKVTAELEKKIGRKWPFLE